MSQGTIGQLLRETREEIPASVYQASRETKIRADFLECMEADDFTFVSGGPYIKGMLRTYVRWLKLDEGMISEMYERQQGRTPEPSLSQVVPEPTDIPPRKRPHWALAAFAAGSILMALWMVGVMRPSQDVAPPPSTPDESREGQTSASQSQAAGTAAPAPAPPADGVKLTLTVVGDRSWVEAYTELPGGGRELVYRGILPAGAAKTFEAKDQLRTLIGNLGAVRLSVNGRDLGVPGRPGQVGNFVFNPGTTTLAHP